MLQVLDATVWRERPSQHLIIDERPAEHTRHHRELSLGRGPDLGHEPGRRQSVTYGAVAVRAQERIVLGLTRDDAQREDPGPDVQGEVVVGLFGEPFADLGAALVQGHLHERGLSQLVGVGRRASALRPAPRDR